MVAAVLADDPNYEYYLQKLTTGSELIEHNFSDSWSGTFDRGSRIISGLYYDRVQSKPFFIPTDSSENWEISPIPIRGIIHPGLIIVVRLNEKLSMALERAMM